MLQSLRRCCEPAIRYPLHPDLPSVSAAAWRRYAEILSNQGTAARWWTIIALTASSRRQGERYEWEIQRRREAGTLPEGVRYAVIPDPEDQRAGSGGATIHALRMLGGARAAWWQGQRVLLIHSGGDSRRLPIYSISGKLFSALPVRTPWGGVSTVFDEWMALSTLWLERMDEGLLVGSGDVVLTFDASPLDWRRPGVSGVGMRQPAEVGTQHGVYVTGDGDRVYCFLQKPSIAEVRAAGGLLEDDQVALDTGLLRFCPESAARLASVEGSGTPVDLYEHITMALTGQWRAREHDAPLLGEVSRAVAGLPFWCAVVDGQFTHVGTTTLFRRIMTEETEFSQLYSAQQRLGVPETPGLRSAGVVIDSVLAGGELAAGSLAIECLLDVPVRAGRGSVLHGLEGISEPVEVPEDVVVHQGAAALPGGGRGTVIRAYGVGDDPKAPAATATWFGRPIFDELRDLGFEPDEVWPAGEARTLWNARLFPVTSIAEAWDCARWLLRLPSRFCLDRWRALTRVSLAESAQWADTSESTISRTRRAQANWRSIATALAMAGSDIRPMLAHAPGLAPLADVGRTLRDDARRLETSQPTLAASRYFQAGLFLGHAGLLDDSACARTSAFAMIERAVAGGIRGEARSATPERWSRESVTVSAPPRIDMGGGWSDTPPFCIDWGGAVLNIAVELNGEYPIETHMRIIAEPLIRCVSAEDGTVEEYRDNHAIARPAGPGDLFAIPRTALRMTHLFDGPAPLDSVLRRLGGGLEVRTRVNLPMGSGLGTSSILGASTVRAVAEMLGERLTEQWLSDRVMRLEQLMTTGGGWQDQAGGIFPGAKLVSSGPGLHQRLRVQPVAWSDERAREFEDRMVLYYTGIRRIAKNLLQTVVGNYLARETAAVEVLHSIKTLAAEMAFAMSEGDWQYLGQLLDRHWQLNQVLDPNTTNAPVNALLARVRPYVWGAKLAGAGGGGFLMLLARDPSAREALAAELARADGGGAICQWRIAREGMRVEARD